MSREGIILITGVLLTVVPYLGIPSDWKKIATVTFGVLLIVIGYSLRRRAYLRSIETETGERHADVFVENASQKLSSDTDSATHI